MSQVIEQELQSYVAALRALTSSRSLEVGDFGEFRRRAEFVVANQFPGANILLLREDGQQIMNTVLPPQVPLPVRTNLENTRQVFATGRPAVSDLYQGQGAVAPHAVVAIDVPVTNQDGKVAYVLSLNPRLGVFAEILRRQSMPPSWLAGVVDGRGVVIARVPDGGYVGQTAAPTLLGHLQTEREGVVESTSLEGISLLTVFSHTGQSGWAIAIGVPKSELTGPAFWMATRILATGGTLLAVSLVLAGFAARGIAAPIRSLRRLSVATDRVALPERVPTGLREVDEISDAFRAADALRRQSQRAEELLRDGIETMPEGFAVFDNDDRLVVCNESYRALFPDVANLVVHGARYEDLLRAGLLNGHYVRTEDREEKWVMERLSEHRAPGGKIEQQLRDGRWVMATKRRLRNGWITSLVVDITALKAAETAYLASEERFRLVIEAVPSSLVVINDLGAIELLNAHAIRTLGYLEAELLGQPVEILIPQGYRHGHPGLRASFFADPKSRPMGAGRDLYALRKDGQEFPVEIGLAPIVIEGRAMVLAAIIDITERTQAERRLVDARHRAEQTLAALSKSEEQLRRAQRLAQMGSEVRDMRTDEVEWSDETYRIFGLSREAFVPTTDNILDLVLKGDREKSLSVTNQIRLGACPSPCEYQIVRPDGTIRCVHREYEFINDEDGAPLYLTGTVQDVTESRRIEAQLRQSQKLEAVGTLTGGMAHDFNNLLGVIILNLGVARRLLVDADQVRDLVADALASARSGADLIRGLLAFARRQSLRPSRIEINEQVSNMNNLLSRVVGEDIEILVELTPNLWPVIADPSQVEASIVNLATNARDAMPKGGRLTIATGNQHLDAAYATLNPAVAPGDYAMITVSDTGTGMAPEVLASVFEPFFTTKEQGKGTGLGLSMVFGFASQSGGHVSIYSEPGLGTTIRLFLPRAPDIAESQAPMRSLSPIGLEKGLGKTVLVVEDNAAMRKAVANQLLVLNYRVLEAESAPTALVMLETEKPDLVFSDVVMPGGMDGFDLAARVRTRWPSVRVLLTSGFSDGQWRAPADGSDLSLRLLSKPYDQEQLARAVWETLNVVPDGDSA